MKCTGLLLFIIAIAFTMNFICAGKWKDTKVKYNRMLLRLIIHKNVDEKGIDRLLETIDKSMESKDPEKLTTYTGLIRESDIIVVTKRLLLWFSLTKKEKRVIRTGGGLLAGMWEINVEEKTKLPKLKLQGKGYAPNLLLIGSQPGIKHFSSDINGKYGNNSQVKWGLEFARHVKSTKITGTDIILKDKGAYSPLSDEGLFIQAKGIIGNSQVEGGIESATDTDPRKNVKGKTRYVLTYRIPANRLEFITDIELKAVKGNFGPITNAHMHFYLPGYESKKIVYASNPEIMQGTPDQLSNITVNKWFKNTVVENTYFYNVANLKHSGEEIMVKTAPGRGRILCMGAPQDKIGIICEYPTNSYIPKQYADEPSLELSDNQKHPKIGKFHKLSYTLLHTPERTLTLTESNKMSLIMRYKIINAYHPLPEETTAANAKNIVKVKK